MDWRISMVKPHLRRCGIIDELTWEPLFYYRDLDAEQREAEQEAEARKVTRYRIGADGQLQCQRFEKPEYAPVADGWVPSEAEARRLHSMLQPPPAPSSLP